MMLKSRKQAILRHFMLGVLLLLIATFLFGLPQYSLLLAHRSLAKSYMVAPQLLSIHRPDGDSFEDEHSRSGRLYAYVLSLDDDNLYCARFTGSSNPFHGLFHLDPDVSFFRSIALGGYQNGGFWAAARGERTTVILPPYVATINHEGRCFIHNTDNHTRYAEIQLMIREEEGYLSFDLPKAEKQNDIFPCILRANTIKFYPANDLDSLWLHGFHIEAPAGSSPIDLNADIGSAYIRAIGEGKQTAEVCVTFYDANQTELYTDVYTLNPDAAGSW